MLFSNGRNMFLTLGSIHGTSGIIDKGLETIPTSRDNPKIWEHHYRRSSRIFDKDEGYS